MRTGSLIAAIVALVIAFGLLLCACSGSENSSQQEEQTYPFDALYSGTWKTVSIESGDEEYTEEILKALDELDMSLVLKLKTDRSCELDVAGKVSFKGTWETVGMLECHVTLEDFGKLTGTYKQNGTLVFTENTTKMVFARQEG